MREYLNCNIRLNQVNREYEVYLSRYHNLKDNLRMFFEMIDNEVSEQYDLEEILVCDEDDNFLNEDIRLEDFNLENGIILNVY